MNGVEFMRRRRDQPPSGVNVRYRAFSHLSVPPKPMEASKATQEPDYQADQEDRADADTRAITGAPPIAAPVAAEAKQQNQDDQQKQHDSYLPGSGAPIWVTSSAPAMHARPRHRSRPRHGSTGLTKAPIKNSTRAKTNKIRESIGYSFTRRSR